MGLVDRVLPEHIQRAGALESQLREYMKNQKMLEQQSNRAMNNREVTTDEEQKKVLEVANRLESLGGNPKVVEQIRKNA